VSEIDKIVVVIVYLLHYYYPVSNVFSL